MYKNVLWVLLIIVSVAAAAGTVYAVSNNLSESTAGRLTVDRQYDITGKFCCEINGIVYFTDNAGILCTAESEKGIKKLSDVPVSDVIYDNKYICYVTHSGIYSYSTVTGETVSDVSDDIVSAARITPENSDPYLAAIDGSGNIYSFSGNMSDISIKYKSSAVKVNDTPRLFSGVNSYAYYNRMLRVARKTGMYDLKEPKFDEYFVSCGSRCYYLNDGLWSADENLNDELKLIDSKDITELCYNDGYAAFEYNGICIINTKNGEHWRLSDEPVSGLCIDGGKVYFTSGNNGQIYSVPVEGGNAVPLTYYMNETVKTCK